MLCRCPSVLRLPESQQDSMGLPWGFKEQGEPLAQADELCAELVTLSQTFTQLQVCCNPCCHQCTAAKGAYSMIA